MVFPFGVVTRRSPSPGRSHSAVIWSTPTPRQVLAVHVSSAPQAALQAPQLALSEEVSTQLAPQTVLGAAHVHVTPSPENPLMQAHVNDPGVFVQAAFAEQFDAPVVHSLMSVHVTPSPE